MATREDERAFEEALGALLVEARPSGYFRRMLASGALERHFPELAACAGVAQSPVYHPEGDVFEHTMLVVDCAAALRKRAQNPRGFMLSALSHDVGKAVTTRRQEDGKITSYGHELAGVALCEAMLRRLTDDEALIDYVKNMVWLHMRPNIQALCRSRKKKTRELFDLSVCPEDLILLSRADASGKLDAPYNEENERFLLERLEDYRRVTAVPGVSEEELIAAGVAPGRGLEACLERARHLRLSGLNREAALAQILAELEGMRMKWRCEGD